MGDRVVYREFGGEPDGESEAGNVDLPPQQQQVRIYVTRKGKGGKTVTAIAGFCASPDTLKALLKDLKNRCGTGGTLGDNELELQGDRRQQALELLRQKGYKAKISGG